MERTFRRYFDLMLGHFGPRGWWPGESAFEVAVGAILTQNTAWTNVEKAIGNLKQEGLLSPESMLAVSDKALESALKPSGYFRVKAVRVRSFCSFLVERYDGNMARMARRPLDDLREELLSVHGIGPETADDILLYACGKSVFVVDAYTRRLLRRHGHVKADIGYEALRALCEKHVDGGVDVYKEYHALIVWTGKEYCKPRPKCDACPLKSTLKRGQPILD